MLRTLLAGAVLTACAAAPAAAWDLTELAARRTENNVQIGDGCSGTIVSAKNRLVLTAYHCITDAVSVEEKARTDSNGEPIIGPDGKPLTAKSKKLASVALHQFFWDADGKRAELVVFATIAARNEKLDVAILRYPDRVGPVATATAARKDVVLLPKGEELQVGATIWSIGNPLMLYGTAGRGIYAGPRNLTDYGLDAVRMYVQYDGGLIGGNSGGALYDDQGRYVGVSVMVVPKATFIGLAVPTADIWTVAEAACLASELGGVDPAKCGPAKRPAGETHP